MTSTGEVACFGATREEALLKAMLAAGFKLPSKGALLALDAVARSTTFVEEVTILRELGLELFATPKTAESLRPLSCVQAVSEEDGSAQHILRSGKVDVVFSDPGVSSASEDRASSALQRLAIDLEISVVGEATLTRCVIQALRSAPLESLEVKPWKHYVSQLSAERTRRTHLRAHGEADEAGARRIRLFIRQPLTETSPREAAIVQDVLDVLQQINGSPYELQFLTGHQAQSRETFRQQFESEAGQQFTPASFRETRLDLLNQADVMIVIRTGLSESGAFEVAYNIFGGKGVPVFFAVWDQAPIRTTLLRDLDELVPVRYVTFSNPEELRQPLLDFLSGFLGFSETGSAALPDLCSWETDEVTAPVGWP
jgi:carbamoyl-phosphate synthase large subunit